MSYDERLFTLYGEYWGRQTQFERNKRLGTLRDKYGDRPIPKRNASDIAEMAALVAKTEKEKTEGKYPPKKTHASPTTPVTPTTTTVTAIAPPYRSGQTVGYLVNGELATKEEFDKAAKEGKN